MEAAINEFIETGEPVSSAELFHRYNFGIKTAMIRHELLNLTDEGFLEQPYHSAGRVPTDLGYRFFAERAIQKASASVAEDLKKMLESGEVEEMLRNFSRSFGLAGIFADQAMRDVHKTGLKYLFENLDTDDQSEFARVAEDFEDIDERLSRSASLFGEDFFEVFVGKNPLTRSDRLSVMGADCDIGGKKFFFFAIGPKRMNYGNAAKVLKGLKVKEKKTAKKKNGRTK